MFNEKSTQWIGIYKVLTVLAFWFFIVLGLVAGIGDYSCAFLDIDIGGDTFFDVILWVIIGAIVAFAQLVANMLIIQLLNNVQIIREKIENK